MADATLTVPAEYVELFTLGAIQQVLSDAENVLKESANTQTFEHRIAPENVQAARVEDVKTAMRSLTDSARLFVVASDASSSAPGEPITLSADAGELAWALAQVARYVITPRLTQAAEVAPLGADIERLTTAMAWVAEQNRALEGMAVEGVVS
jgi:hypothetical protein